TNPVPAREPKHLRDECDQCRRMVCPAIGKSNSRDDATIRSNFDITTELAEEIACAVARQLFEGCLLVVVAHVAGAMLGHADAETSLEPAGIAAGPGISFVPSHRLCPFLKNFDGCERVVRERAVLDLVSRSEVSGIPVSGG